MAGTKSYGYLRDTNKDFHVLVHRLAHRHVILSGGGTTTLNYFIYQEAFETFNLGRASAAAYVLLVITFAVVIIPIIIRFILNRYWGNYNAKYFS